MPVVRCLNCGKEFKVIPSVIKRGGGKFCSIKCKGEYKRRFGKKVKISKEQLEKLYFDRKMSMREIAQMYGVSYPTIYKLFKEYGIRIKSRSESRKEVWDKRAKKRMEEIKIDSELIELVDGILLGDGTIGNYKRPRLSLELPQRIDRREWLEWVSDFLLSKGIKSWISHINKPNGLDMCVLETERLIFFTDQRKRWYPNDKKRVPEDVRLTPLSLAMWYFGDGSLRWGNHNQYYIQLATDGFTEDDVELLINKLEENYYFKPKKHRSGYGFRIKITGKKQVLRFLKIIEKYKINCFAYKFL